MLSFIILSKKTINRSAVDKKQNLQYEKYNFMKKKVVN